MAFQRFFYRVLFIGSLFITHVFAEDINFDLDKTYTTSRGVVAKNALNRSYFYDPTEKTFWQKLAGESTPNRFMFDMFSAHLKDRHSENWHNEAFVLFYHGYFAGTFVNSLYNRAYVVGIDRYWFTTTVNRKFEYSLGYRLGLITGYTEKTYWLAKYSPVLPFPQVVFDMTFFTHAQLELSWCAQVLSAAFVYRF